MVEVEMGNNPQFGNSMGSELLPVEKHCIHALFPVIYKGSDDKEVPANFLDFWSLEGNLDEIEGKLKEIKELEETKVNLLTKLKNKEEEDEDLEVLKELKKTGLIKLAELIEELKNKPSSPESEEVQKLIIELKKLKTELKNNPSSSGLKESIDLKIKELIDRSLSPEYRELITEFGKLSESKDKELKELNRLKGLKGLEVDTVLSDIGFKDLIKCTDNNPAVWQLQDKGKGLSLGDFYPYIRQIIGGDDSNQLKLCTSFRLATPQILSQVKGGKDRLFTLDLTPSAQKRCGRNAPMFQFDDARVFVFRSGIVILDLSWHYEKQNNVEENNAEESDEDKKRLKVNAVLEGNYLLSHDNHRSKHGKDQTSINDEESHGMTAQRLRDIAEALLPKIGDFVPEIHADRRILYSLVEISKEVKAEQLSQISIWLSHRNTSDYMPSKNIVEHDLLQPFPYLCHAASIEGGASVICQASMESEYIEHFISGSASKAYLPLFIASLHSHFWLLNQTQWIPAGRSKSNSREESEGMDSVFEDTVGFRRNFHFPLVSQISLYNRFHAHWQEALKIPERIRFQEQTARDVSELLKTRRTRWIGRFSGAVGGFLITHEVMEIVSKNGFIGAVPDMRVWLVDVAFKSHDEIEHMVSLVENWEYAIFVGSLVGAAFGFLLSFWFDKVVKKE
jgi:hypothetical protein